MKTLITILTLLFLTLMSDLLFADTGEKTAKFLTIGDAAHARFDNEAALTAYEKALERDPQNYEAAWKLSRAYIDVGEKHENGDRRIQYFKKGREMAEKGVLLNPDDAKGHLFLSIALGRTALDEGPREKVQLSKDIRSEVGKALTLDENEDAAWHVLALWHREVSSLSWIERKFANLFFGGIPEEASMENAVSCLEKAVELNPEHINHHLELGITYEKMKKKALARSEYETVMNLPVTDADDEDLKTEAEKYLKKLK